MIEAVAAFTLLMICVEAITEILVASSIFAKPREFIARRSGLLGELVHCGYCTSVWVSAAVAWIIPLWYWALVPHFWVSYLVTLFVLHRLSNLFHELISKWLNRRPISLAVHKTETVLLPDIGNNDDQE